MHKLIDILLNHLDRMGLIIDRKRYQQMVEINCMVPNVATPMTIALLEYFDNDLSVLYYDTSDCTFKRVNLCFQDPDMIGTIERIIKTSIQTTPIAWTPYVESE